MEDSYSSKDTIDMNVMYITVEPLYNEVLALTNYFFNSSNRRVHNMVLKSRLLACFFILIPPSRLFLLPNPNPAPFFFYEFLAFIIQCLRLAFLKKGALMFKVLDLAISDRNFILFFCFSERMRTRKKVYFDLSSGHLETASCG